METGVTSAGNRREGGVTDSQPAVTVPMLHAPDLYHCNHGSYAACPRSVSLQPRFLRCIPGICTICSHGSYATCPIYVPSAATVPMPHAQYMYHLQPWFLCFIPYICTICSHGSYAARRIYTSTFPARPIRHSSLLRVKQAFSLRILASLPFCMICVL